MVSNQLKEQNYHDGNGEDRNLLLDFKVLYLVRQPSVGQTHANTAERRIGKTLKLRCPKTWAQILFPVLTISVRT